MSLEYPSLRPKADGKTVLKEHTGTGPFGVPEVLVDGFHKLKNDLHVSHPLEFSEKQYTSNLEQMDFKMLRDTQGLHAPLRLKIERDVAARFERLPGMHSSHLMSDILTGRLDTLDFDDILCDPMDAEMAGSTHMLMERRLGI